MDEEERRMLTMLETHIAKGDGALAPFFCPIIGDVMEEPYICVVSQNSYEKSAIMKHCAGCYERREQPYDPISRKMIKDPIEGIRNSSKSHITKCDTRMETKSK